MNEVTDNDVRLRQFLLGELDEEERERIEELFMSESSARDSVLMAEDDLIEEYLEGSLQGPDLAKFRAAFLATPQLRRKLRIARSLRRHARVESNLDTQSTHDEIVAEKPVTSLYSKLLELWGSRNFPVYAPVAAAIVLAIILGIIWYAEYRREQSQNITQRRTIERELAELNSPSNVTQLPADQVLSVVLPLVSGRSSGPRISPPENATILELWLLPGTMRSEIYVALVHKAGSEDRFEVSNLRLEDRPSGKAIRLRIPTRLLTRGLYSLRLNGLSPDGRVETGEYSFEVSR